MSRAALILAVADLQKTIAGLDAQSTEHFNEEVRLTSDLLGSKKLLQDARNELEIHARLNVVWLTPVSFYPGVVLRRKGLPKPEWGVHSVRNGTDAHDTLVCLVHQDLGNELWVRYTEIESDFEPTGRHLSVMRR